MLIVGAAVVTTTDAAEAWKDVDVAILVAGLARKKGMERNDVMAKNVSIYKEQASVLVEHASRDVKVDTDGWFPYHRLILHFRNNAVLCPEIKRANKSILFSC